MTELILTLPRIRPRRLMLWLVVGLSLVSLLAFFVFYRNGLNLAYNDARSHLDIGRRVVEGLKPGIAQLGSVWLPLTHVLMVPTVWNDFMWHSGLSGSLQSMLGFVFTGILIYAYLKKLNVGLFGRLAGVSVFVLNLNVLYLQSTPMTELPLLFTMTAGCYFLLAWLQSDRLLDLALAAFLIMLSTLIRYDGWFLLLTSSALVGFCSFRSRGYRVAEGAVVLFATLAGFGVALWFLWNQLIFGDALYFVFGPFSAWAQQAGLEAAGVLATKGHLLFSAKIYLYAVAYTSGALTLVFGLLGALIFWADRTKAPTSRLATTTLFTPLLFNVFALFLGHSVLFVQGLSGNSLFNIRYGVMLMPTLAIFIGYLVHRLTRLRSVIIGSLLLVAFFAFANQDAVTIDDARVGSSQKNVTEVSGWLAQNAKDQPGFVLISAASHDAIIFSSGLPMKKFIHEGTGAYWESATNLPDRWARWIIMRTYDDHDLTWKFVSRSPGFTRYDLVGSFPFADIYQLQPRYLPELQTEPVLKQFK